jgi:hypothetical protein
MSTDDADWLLRFLHEFASMSERERDAAIDTLSPEERGALVALADARTASAGADLVEVLDAGQSGLDKLYELIQPADLYAVINLAVRQHPNIVVEALFAAVVLHRAWNREDPAEMIALREQWHWHLHERLGQAPPPDQS